MAAKGYLSTLILIVLCLTGFGCKTDSDTGSFHVAIAMLNEPDNLHPIFSKSTYATQIESLILLPMAEYDPVSMELSPLLITEIPTAVNMKEGPFAGNSKYELTIRPEAVWADGKPVTAADYEFTLKSVYNPHVKAPTWTGFLDQISSIHTNPDDPKKLTVYIDSSYLLRLECVTNFNVYPAHHYDAKNIMTQFSLEQLRNAETTYTPEQDTLLKQFATDFESVRLLRDQTMGSGPYELAEWVTGEYIRLTKKQDYWGDQIANAPLCLQGHPQEIRYRFIIDGGAAIAALKAGELDLVPEITPDAFDQVKEDAQWKDKFHFATPLQMQVNFIELNTRDSILADPRVRQALSYSIDYDAILNELMEGYADRTIGPFHPSKPYFHTDLKPIQQDIAKAQSLLKEAGWTDTNQNGTPDKKIDGKTTELQLSIKITNKEEGTITANILRNSAAKAGFDIQIEVLESGQMQQDMRQQQFDMTPLRVASYPNDDDPYNVWHSDSDRPGGSNRNGYHSDELDALIEQIRKPESEQKQLEAYRQFQEIIYRDQPTIYLYVPHARIIASQRVSLITSLRRPGYFENLLKPAGK